VVKTYGIPLLILITLADSNRLNCESRVSHQVIVDLIAATHIDSNRYPAGIKISDKQLAELNIERDSFHGECN